MLRIPLLVVVGESWTPARNAQGQKYTTYGTGVETKLKAHRDCEQPDELNFMAARAAPPDAARAAPPDAAVNAGPSGRSGSHTGMLWLMGVLFFLQSWSPQGMLRTGSLYLLDRGMSVQQIGAIEAATLFAPALTNPLMGLAADRMRSRKAVSLLTMAASLAVLMCVVHNP